MNTFNEHASVFAIVVKLTVPCVLQSTALPRMVWSSCGSLARLSIRTISMTSGFSDETSGCASS